ncbi:glycosyltransferase family 39 protein [Cryobacterium breve]|uniref:Glycosyltransferase family 39 protein n=1 Tax=Cryobacterium breve TaxID=1259258 RepID=A0ABY7NBE2_9MICO|nr:MULTISPECIES: glycosyltransferase family 39 protein [Cryobacterium]MDY7543322.1 glycosyltransferase family 39 protein [Cryobacterium sp. 5B3]MEB0000486.1 glycosyltransferase family 39 protein [Cryobacterium sp. RTS3]MEB0276130.1 glycosyltransferase family 39 protein [Cryobacterium sp. 5B3]WBM79811.1 glycosyltransferase family 39 protein [Cryobacterium breve]
MTGHIVPGHATRPPVFVPSAHGASTSSTPSTADSPSTARRGLLARAILGERADAAWIRPSFWALLIMTGLLYLWNLSESGWANSFYAAAVQAGSKSWTALFFGSLDSSNFITVDKPPASLWVMGLSARIFGFSSWSVLVPQALMGVAAVALVFATVRRSLVAFGPRLGAVGGLVAGALLAFTPAAALMFRFDNPDALLTVLMTAAAYCVIRALPSASWRWLALAGVALGFAFLTKMLQGLLVLPAFGLAYLLLANTTVWRRLAHLGIAAGALVVSAGWWVLAVALWPASARPYIGGSTDNTVLDLVFGYNGLGRIFGATAGGGGNAGGGGTTAAAGSSFGGATGLDRLFSSEMGLEISWLLPTALLALVLGLWATRKRHRIDGARAALVVWGGWLLVTGLVFSYMSGTIHPYYTVALAPAIAGLVGTGGVVLWHGRSHWFGRLGLAAMIAAAGAWGFVLLSENADWLPWLRWTLLAVTLIGVASFVVGAALSWRRLTTVAVLVGMLGGLGGSAAYAIATASVAHNGSIPSVGSISSSSGMGGGTAGGLMGGAPTGGGGTRPDGGTPPEGAGGTPPTGGTGGPDGSGTTGTTDTGTGTGTTDATGSGTTDTGTDAAANADGSGSAPSGSGSDSATASDLTALLAASTARWAAAVDGSQSAATLELSTGVAVMAIGGWSSDPTPTLAEFQAAVAAGDVGYYISGSQGGGGGMGGGDSTATAIATWVAATYTATTVGGSTVYDLSSPAA